MENTDSRINHEISHGKFLAENNPGEIWNWEGPAGKKRWERRVRMLTADIRPTDRVLELGCGSGYFSAELAKTGAQIVAIDISPDLLKLAQENVPVPNVSFQRENAYDMSFGDDSFDVVVGSSVLHHLDVNKALQEMLRVLKPGGVMRFTEPNMLNPQIALQKNIPYLKRRMGDSPDETAFFRWPLSQLLADNGFVEVNVKPFDFLHPQIPGKYLRQAAPACQFCETVPLLKEIAGSLYITAKKMKCGDEE